MVRLRLNDANEAMQRAFTSAGITPDEVSKVLLVGGSSRMPIVAALVSSGFGRPVAVDAHPKHAVPLGATLVAASRRLEPQGLGTGDVITAETDAVESDPTLAIDLGAGVAVGMAAATAPRQRADAEGSRGQREPLPALAAGEETPPVPSPVPPPEHDLTMEPASTGTAGGSSTGPAGRGRKATIGVVVALVVVAAVAAFLALRRDDPQTTIASAPDETAITTGAAGSPTTSPPPTTSRSATVNGISIDEGNYAVSFTTDGFTPEIDGGPDSHHLHFFFNTTAPENAGTNGNPPGPWVIYDGPSPFTGLAVEGAEGSEGATQICVVVATVSHEVDDPASGNCIDLP
jgi:hypothetical protein